MESEWVRLLMGAVTAGVMASTAALIRVLIRVARLEERVSDVEQDLSEMDEMGLRMWKTLQRTELLVTRVEERQISSSHAVIEELRKISEKRGEHK